MEVKETDTVLLCTEFVAFSTFIQGISLQECGFNVQPHYFNCQDMYNKYFVKDVPDLL